MNGGTDTATRSVHGLRSWLNAPLSGTWCALGWTVANALFVALVSGFGGFSLADTYQSVFSTWLVAHGQFVCTFPRGFHVTAPLYPLLSGAVAGIGHFGQGSPLPPQSAMGPSCDNAFVSLNNWSATSGALGATLKIGFLGWLSLMGGIVALLRATGRGCCGWEPLTLLLVACSAPVWVCVQSTFHPEDLLAMGLALGALACARRGSWAGAGVLIGLAFLSQQFALLVAVPLFFLAPAPRRFSYASVAGLTVTIVAVPLTIVTSGTALHFILLGTGTTGGIGGAVLCEFGLHGSVLMLVSRGVPLALAGAIAWATARRLGAHTLDPVPLLSVMALSLGLRLVFEQQIFLYYFMALTVALILVAVVRARFSAALVAWLLLVPTAFLGEISDFTALDRPFRVVVLVLSLALAVRHVVRGAPLRDVAPWAAVVATTVVAWSPAGLPFSFPMWFWQAVLVSWGLALAAGPLLAELRRHEVTAPRTHLVGSGAVAWTPRFAKPVHVAR